MCIAGVVLCLMLLAYIEGLESERICAQAYSNQTHVSIERDYPMPNPQGQEDTSPVETCRKGANSCYAFWKEVKNASNETIRVILAQGCWESSGKEDCEADTCVAERKPPKALNNTKFCCCSGDLCNSNVTQIDEEWIEEPNFDLKLTHPSPPTSNLSRRETIVVLAACLMSLLGVVVALAGLYRRWSGSCTPRKPLMSDSVHLMEGGNRGNNGHQIEQLKLTALIGQGHYGTVWRGTVNDQEVAIKIFPSHYRQYYHNERDIYSLPFMDCPALLTYYGSNERMSLDNCTEYLLVLSYCSNGCLQEYLRNNTLDLPTFCKMALSVAKGLAHLHTDIRKGDKCKPCVCHRDLNTRNILVKNDLNCCLCDLGLAIKIVGSHYYTLGEEQHAETKSINDVGSLRYMAPEVLEGAVNLRDCESSLKQIDVYALGLVLWELATRCADLYQPGVEIPPYRMPFEAEIGHHPSFEQMQVLVTRNKARPLFPELWRDCPGVRLIRETIEDCWDQDAEARLTALCVEERLLELTTLTHRGTMYQSGVSPTVNATQTQLMALPSYNNNNHTIDSAEDTGEKEGLESTISEGTVETLLTLSPSEPYVENLNQHSKNSNSRAQQPITLQPHQGRNPCIERNLMWDANATSDLIDRSMKHHPHNTSETQSLVGSDYLNLMPRPVAPIPFVQNAVFDPHTFQTIPKQPNVPGNGNCNKQLGGILPKPLRKFLDARKNRTDLCPKSYLRTRILKETEVSVGDKRVVTAVLGSDKENSDVALDVKNDFSKKETKSGNGVKVIISPFEERSDGTLERKSAERPSSLPLVPFKEKTTERKINLDEIFIDGGKSKLKDLACRIKTPGDVPPSVRRKRGKSVLGEARFSLYDDRMMEGIDLDREESESAVTSRSVPSGIENSGTQVKVDSSF